MTTHLTRSVMTDWCGAHGDTTEDLYECDCRDCLAAVATFHVERATDALARFRALSLPVVEKVLGYCPDCQRSGLEMVVRAGVAVLMTHTPPRDAHLCRGSLRPTSIIARTP